MDACFAKIFCFFCQALEKVMQEPTSRPHAMGLIGAFFSKRVGAGGAVVRAWALFLRQISDSNFLMFFAGPVVHSGRVACIRLIKLGLSIDEDDAAADEGEDDIPDLDDAEGDEESTMEQVD